ncbi:ZIP family metal transporter [Phaeacidiphilus oryzae]|uniref:ZIP family metal transporter n=1 Tax=Phaeacidiphilus oryzae TaxID=348818 RepID=UPI00056BC394|nr:ZIP family metal transporter [Phaeacidiphilus oryzae]
MPVVVAAGAMLMTLLGGLVAGRVGDRRHLVLGLAAGLMLGVVAFDLIPEALHAADFQWFGVPSALVLATGGFLLLHIVERSIAIHRAHEGEYAAHSHDGRHLTGGPDGVPGQGHGHGHGHGAGHGHAHGHGFAIVDGRAQGLGLAAAGGLVVHSMMDGFAIGAAFQASNTIGAVVAVAVIAHDFADGFNTYTITSLYGNDRRRALTLLACDALAPIVGAAITLAFDIPEQVLGLYLGFFSGVLLYLATSDILPEAHAQHPSRATLVCTVAGAAFMWLVIGLAG